MTQNKTHSDKFLGFTFSFGIFQDYYSTHEPFKSSGDIAIVGTCAMVSFQSR
jgi:hypothetical protein